MASNLVSSMGNLRLGGRFDKPSHGGFPDKPPPGNWDNDYKQPPGNWDTNGWRLQKRDKGKERAAGSTWYKGPPRATTMSSRASSEGSSWVQVKSNRWSDDAADDWQSRTSKDERESRNAEPGGAQAPGAGEKKEGNKSDRACKTCGTIMMWNKMMSFRIEPDDPKYHQYWALKGNSVAQAEWIRENGEPPRHTFEHQCPGCYASDEGIDMAEAVKKIWEQRGNKTVERCKAFRKTMQQGEVCLKVSMGGEASRLTQEEISEFGTKMRFHATNPKEALDNPGAILGEYGPAAEQAPMKGYYEAKEAEALKKRKEAGEREVDPGSLSAAGDTDCKAQRTKDIGATQMGTTTTATAAMVANAARPPASSPPARPLARPPARAHVLRTQEEWCAMSRNQLKKHCRAQINKDIDWLRQMFMPIVHLIAQKMDDMQHGAELGLQLEQKVGILNGGNPDDPMGLHEDMCTTSDKMKEAVKKRRAFADKGEERWLWEKARGECVTPDSRQRARPPARARQRTRPPPARAHPLQDDPVLRFVPCAAHSAVPSLPGRQRVLLEAGPTCR